MNFDVFRISWMFGKAVPANCISMIQRVICIIPPLSFFVEYPALKMSSILFAFALLFTAATCFRFPSRNAFQPDSFASHEFDEEPLFPLRSFRDQLSFVPPFRISAKTKETCKSKINPLRTITVANEFVPEEDGSTVFEKDMGASFLSKYVKFSDRQIKKSKQKAMKYIKKRFGINLKKFTFDPSTGTYSRGTSGFGFAIIDEPLYKISDSNRLVDCPNTTALLAFYVLGGYDVVYTGTYGGEAGVKVNGESIVFFGYMVFSPGAKKSTILEIKSTKPTTCGVPGVCAFVGTTKVVDDFRESKYQGKYTGTLIEDPKPKKGSNVGKQMFSLTLTWD